MKEKENVPPEIAVAHWGKTRALMWTCIAVWALFSFGVHFFVNDLNNLGFFGFPFGFYLAAQGSLIVFVILIFWFASRQNAIDEEFGVAED